MTCEVSISGGWERLAVLDTASDPRVTQVGKRMKINPAGRPAESMTLRCIPAKNNN
jgi:hypothetical protein